MPISDLYRKAKDKCDPIIVEARDNQPGKELPPATLTHGLDVLRGWLPNITQESSDTFRAWKKQEVAATRARSTHYNMLIANGAPGTPSAEQAKLNPKYVDQLEDEAKLHSDSNEVANYREDVKECINILKAQLKSLGSDYKDS